MTENLWRISTYSIIAALNSAMSQKDKLIREITGAMQMELAPISGETMSLADIDRRLEEINKETHIMIAKSSKIGEITNYAEQFKALLDETTALKEKRAFIQEQQRTNDEVARRIEAATSIKGLFLLLEVEGLKSFGKN